ncbi:hypothetical protein [Rahnella sp. PCH160]|uniref:hypothetical protein n=1 Tax=Rahnella sp. PCH160 TaxID=3447928 RepID=UPI0039FC82F5
MSKLIFRRIGGVVRPITVDDVIDSERQYQHENRTPKYDVKNRRYDSLTSFVVPNVKCNECGMYVFYYENQNGARVLFDFLGPPWPVHPCYLAAQDKPNVLNIPKKEEGWHPVIIQKAINLSGGGIRIQACDGDKIIRFEFDASTFLRFKCSPDAICTMLCFINPRKRSSVQVHNGKKMYQTHFDELKKHEKVKFYAESNDDLDSPIINYDVSLNRDEVNTTLKFKFGQKDYTYHILNKVMDVHFSIQDTPYICCNNINDNINLYFFGKKTGCRFDLDPQTDKLVRAEEYEDYFLIITTTHSEDDHLILKGMYKGERITVVSQDIKFRRNQTFINSIRNKSTSVFLIKSFMTENGTDSRLLLTKDKNGELRYNGSVVYRKKILSINKSQEKMNYHYDLSSLIKENDGELLRHLDDTSLIKVKVLTLKLISLDELLVSLIFKTVEIPLIIKSHKLAIRQLDIDLRAVGTNIRIRRNSESEVMLYVNKQLIGAFSLPVKKNTVSLSIKREITKTPDIQSAINNRAKDIDVSSHALAHAFLAALKKPGK